MSIKTCKPRGEPGDIDMLKKGAEYNCSDAGRFYSRFRGSLKNNFYMLNTCVAVVTGRSLLIGIVSAYSCNQQNWCHVHLPVLTPCNINLSKVLFL